MADRSETFEPSFMRALCMGNIEEELIFPYPALAGHESETLREIDRFCDAMIAIAAEIDRVGSGEWPVDDSPLRHAPHTAEELLGDWERPYSREIGAFPLPSLRVSKYFPPVSRIDGAYGDRNLVCACPPMSDYQ